MIWQQRFFFPASLSDKHTHAGYPVNALPPLPGSTGLVDTRRSRGKPTWNLFQVRLWTKNGEHQTTRVAHIPSTVGAALSSVPPTLFYSLPTGMSSTNTRTCL